MRPEVSRVEVSRRRRSALRRAQSGAIAIMAAILLPVMFGFGAFVIDLARLYVYKTEIQNAMDACALGASLALTGVNDTKIFDQGRAYGRVVMDPAAASAGGARPDVSINRLHLQRDNFALDNVVVEYSTALSGQPWVAATGTSGGLAPTAARFARCSYQDLDNPLFFLPLLKALVPGVAERMTVAASAAASLTPAQSACAFPVAMCASPGTNAGTNWGLTPGQRYTSVTSTPPVFGPGAFGFLDFDPPAGGAAELAAAMIGSGACAVELGDPVGAPGFIASVRDAWNSRFGIYPTGGGGPNALNVNSAPPDRTGISFPAPSTNRYPAYVAAAASNTAFQGGLPNNRTKTLSPQLATFGQKRRVVTAAIVNCAALGGGGTPPVLDFACILLLAPVPATGSPAWTQVSPTMDVEFLGLASKPGTPCASLGQPGGTFGPPIPTLVQ